MDEQKRVKEEKEQRLREEKNYIKRQQKELKQKMAQLEELFNEGKREEAQTLSAQIQAQSESLQEQEMDLAERTS